MPTFLIKPTPEQREHMRRETQSLPLSFDFVGATRGEGVPGEQFFPAGFNVDRYRQDLGRGRATFDRARAVLQEWGMYPAGWAEIAPRNEPLVEGLVVTVLARVLFTWVLAPVRVIYLIEEEDSQMSRFGFAIGTLAGHPERGEERFLLEWNRADDSVVYQILAVSRPAVWYAWLSYPLTRLFQKRFGRDSKRAMLAAVAAVAAAG